MRLIPLANLSGSRVPLSSGRAGVLQTMRAMRACVNEGKMNPRIRAAAIHIVQFSGDKDYADEARTLFEYVRDHVRYVRDVLDIETLATPARTLDTMSGDCDDQTTLLASLLESIGHPTRFVVTGYRAPGQYEHVYLQTWIQGRWINCDPTEPNYFGWAPPNPRAVLIEGV